MAVTVSVGVEVVLPSVVAVVAGVVCAGEVWLIVVEKDCSLDPVTVVSTVLTGGRRFFLLFVCDFVPAMAKNTAYRSKRRHNIAILAIYHTS